MNQVPIAYSASGIRCQVMDGGDRNVEGWFISALAETALTARCLSGTYCRLECDAVWCKGKISSFGRTCCSPEVILANPRKILSLSHELRSL